MPVVWLIDAYRAGERAQVRALAEGLGWPYETKCLAYRNLSIGSKLFRRSDLSGIDVQASDSLQAPWPDLVISCGMANEPVCRWIRDQSGGCTRIVHVGRPWSLPEQFDLVITTPQYRLQRHSNVLVNELTLHGIDTGRLEEAAARWRERFADLPGPSIALLCGGNSGPYTFGAKSAARLARMASDRARELGGSLLVSTSSRTADAAVAALADEIDVPNYLYRWQPDDPANPYLGMLALADEVIVTADSIAMLSEAVATARPVWMYDLGNMREEVPAAIDFRAGAVLYRLLMRWGWGRLSRDITLIHRQLLESGQARWLGDISEVGERCENHDLQRAVARVRELFEVAGPVI